MTETAYIHRALWDAWEREDLTPREDGRRAAVPVIEARWVRWHPECKGWSDWTSVAVIENDRVVWICDAEKREGDPCDPTVYEAVAAQCDILFAVRMGDTQGTLVEDKLHLQWRLRE